MIIKNADSKTADFALLESLLISADERQKKLIIGEIRTLQAGIKAEEESAYLLDFTFAKSTNTAIAHDLRLQVGNRVAQIDHLVVHHTHRFYVLETKSFAHGLKITEQGEFLRWNGFTKNYEGMSSPVEQNRRHAMVLKEMLERMGHKNPNIECFVLVSSKARIDRPAGNKFPEVVKADQFFTAYQKNIDASLNSVGGFLSGIANSFLGERPDEIVKRLVQMHRPMKFDYAAKFGMTGVNKAEPHISFAATPNSEPTVAARSHPSPASTPSPAKKITAESETAAATKSPPKIGVPACKSCTSVNVSVQYGKFGYYFKCGSCGANTSIKLSCGLAGHKERLRKDGLTFYRECADCKTSSLYFVNSISV